MKISTKGRYGVRFMLDLALNAMDRPIPLKEIAKRQEISDKYLEQIVIILGRSGLVKSVRGAQGGYILAKDPQEISVGQILRSLEGSLAPVDCVDCEGKDCPRADKCVTLGVWTKIRKAIEDVVDNTYLSELVQEYQDSMKSCDSLA